MMKKQIWGVIGILSIGTMLTACSTPKEKTEDSKTKESTVESTVISTEESEKETKDSQASSDSNILEDYHKEIEKITEAESFKTVYSHSEPIETKQGDLSIILDGYEMVEAENISSDLKIPYGRQTERGAIYLAKFTVRNDGKDNLYFPLAPDYTFTGATKAYADTSALRSDKFENIGSLLHKLAGEVKPGEEVTGYQAVMIDPEGYDKLKESNVFTMVVPTAFSVKDSVKTADKVGDKINVQLGISDSGKDKAATAGEFLQDKASTDNMGEKKMLVDKQEVNEQKTSQNVEATLQSYQFTEFIPNEDEAPRFRDFSEGVVLLTVSFDVKNNGDKAINMSSSSAALNVNNGSQRVLSTGMLSNYTDETIAKGETKEMIQVFAMDKEQYDKIWKDKDFSLELKLIDEEFKNMDTQDELSYELKTK